MNKVKIAILGLGNVGKGVWKILQKNENEIMKRSGYEIEVAKILVRDKNKSRDVEVPEGILTDNFEEILNDKEIKIVIELMGGAEPSKEYMLRSMKAKKHVVTANKLVLANWGEELFKTSQQENVQFYYEASVGGGIPIIREINESLTANRIKTIIGILNGTTNYILSKMTLDGMSYEKALKEAQEKGYAEADPTSDVEGYDVSYKLAIISSLAFGMKVHPDLIFREGINNINSIDIEYAKKFGYRIKLLAIAKERNNKLELRVHPALVPNNHPFANVNDSFNAIFIKGNAVGDLMLIGRGAGDLPTGSAVVGDLISILRNNELLPAANVLNNRLGIKEIKNPDENEPKFYIRLNIKDTAGVLGQISTIFGENNISILSVTQDINQEEDVSLVFITYNSMEKNMKDSLEIIEQLDSVNKVESILRIENFN
ncbi:MAG: homoserine dehydrogenase [Bacillota bacterium]|nr:homoserine dehydrogenase [Bacillota bacterium]